MRKLVKIVLVVLASVLFTQLIQHATLTNDLLSSSLSSSPECQISTNRNAHPHPRIAIISSFIVGEQSSIANFDEFDAVINKACYAKMWNYDFIFNMTHGFDRSIIRSRSYDPYWLNYGTWHRVPHIRGRIEDYDWILYADTDYIINDMSRSLESFFKEFELHGMKPSILIPKDFDDGTYTFSAFALLIKNDDFGHSILKHWMDFAYGLCKNGNLVSNRRPYNWEDSDQPGLWYALRQAHQEFYPQYNVSTKAVCNTTSGLIDTLRAFGVELNEYFNEIRAGLGNYGLDLKDIPIDQPIIWSRPNVISKGGLGVQIKWGVDAKDLEALLNGAFAFHHNDVELWSEQARHNLDLCKRLHGCYANYTDSGELQIGCDGVQYTVVSD